MIDKHSETWRDVAAWAESTLSEASERIETLGVEPAETENLRGHIACLRGLLGLADGPVERVVVPAEGYGFQGPDES